MCLFETEWLLDWAGQKLHHGKFYQKIHKIKWERIKNIFHLQVEHRLMRLSHWFLWHANTLPLNTGQKRTKKESWFTLWLSNALTPARLIWCIRDEQRIWEYLKEDPVIWTAEQALPLVLCGYDAILSPPEIFYMPSCLVRLLFFLRLYHSIVLFFSYIETDGRATFGWAPL